MRAGAGIESPFRKAYSETLRCGPLTTGIDVVSPERAVTPVSVADLLGQLNERTGDNLIYMSVSYDLGRESYELITPCRYLNYTNFEQEGPRYLQPISGYVPLEIDGRFFMGYVVLYVTEQGVRNAEIGAVSPINLFDAKSGIFPRGAALLKFLLYPLRRVFMISDVSLFRKIDPTVTFFRYQ